MNETTQPGVAGSAATAGAGPAAAGEAAGHFSAEALGEPAGTGRFVKVADIPAAEFAPGLGFRPVLGQRAMANFVQFEPGATAPRHVHEEEQLVIVLEGEFFFDLDGDVRVLRPGDVAVVPSWVPHAAWTTDSRCFEVDIFCPPRKTLLQLAQIHSDSAAAGRPEPEPGEESGDVTAQRPDAGT
jgi:quercetin dioxygenase-like cupin family protein